MRIRKRALIVLAPIAAVGAILMTIALGADGSNEKTKKPLVSNSAVSQQDSANVRVVYVKIPDGKGAIEKRQGEGVEWSTASMDAFGNENGVWAYESRNRFRVDGNKLSLQIAKVIGDLTREGYQISQVVPISRGYSRVSSPGKAGGGWGYGVSPTDGVLIVAIR